MQKILDRVLNAFVSFFGVDEGIPTDSSKSMVRQEYDEIIGQRFGEKFVEKVPTTKLKPVSVYWAKVIEPKKPGMKPKKVLVKCPSGSHRVFRIVSFDDGVVNIRRLHGNHRPVSAQLMAA